MIHILQFQKTLLHPTPPSPLSSIRFGNQGSSESPILKVSLPFGIASRHELIFKSAQWRVCVSRRFKFRLKTVRSEQPRLSWGHYSLCITRTKLCRFALYRSARLVHLRTVRSFSMSACYYRLLILFHPLDCLHSVVEALLEWTFLS